MKNSKFTKQQRQQIDLALNEKLHDLKDSLRFFNGFDNYQIQKSIARIQQMLIGNATYEEKNEVAQLFNVKHKSDACI